MVQRILYYGAKGREGKGRDFHLHHRNISTGTVNKRISDTCSSPNKEAKEGKSSYVGSAVVFVRLKRPITLVSSPNMCEKTVHCCVTQSTRVATKLNDHSPF